jgi:Iron-containing redox enzyme
LCPSGVGKNGATMQPTTPRGPLSDWVLSLLREAPGVAAPSIPALPAGIDAAVDEDLHLALFLCYELQFGGIEGVDDAWGWDPRLIAGRSAMERPFESAMRASATSGAAVEPGTIDVRLREVLRLDDGPSVARYLERHGTTDQVREFLMHRSIYQLREADPHSFGIPRIGGAAKAALVEIQADEYGGGDPSWMHSALFARAMRALDLDDTFGAYLDRLPGSTLAWVNLMSLFGLHRRLRGALIGHLAAFEMTSCIPNRRYGDALRRLGFGPDATAYFDEHVEADAVHEAVAANELAGSFVAAEPDLEDDVLFGARALLATETALARGLLSAWEEGRSSLRAERFTTAA